MTMTTIESGGPLANPSSSSNSDSPPVGNELSSAAAINSGTTDPTLTTNLNSGKLLQNAASSLANIPMDQTTQFSSGSVKATSKAASLLSTQSNNLAGGATTPVIGALTTLTTTVKSGTLITAKAGATSSSGTTLKPISNPTAGSQISTTMSLAKSATTLTTTSQIAGTTTTLKALQTTTTTTTSTTTTTATTTTTRPPCLTYPCSVKAGALNANGQVDTTKLQNATFQQACDRLYVFGLDLLSWTEAASYCCSLGMQLLSIETREEMVCIYDLMNSEDGANLTGEYFTSGSDYQIASSFVWCTANFTPFNSSAIYWNRDEPSKTSFLGAQEDCVSVKLSTGQQKKNVLNDVECSAKMKFICEVPVPPTTKPPCLPYTCEMNKTLLDSDDFLMPNAPINGNLRIACGRMYFFGKEQGDWASSASKCCQMNMHLTALETVEERQCYNNMIRTPYYGTGFPFITWTGASDQYHENLFTWCTPKRGSNIINSALFSGNEPSNGGGIENCVSLNADAAKNVAYNDASCATVYRYNCETVAPDCPFPECPVYTCVKDPEKYALSRAWKKPPDGEFRSSCGKQYFVSNISLNPTEALAECCKYGLKLLSVESKEELDCLVDTIKMEVRTPQYNYWTSGTNLGYGCDFTYGWCGNNVLAPNISAILETPTNPLNERCIQFKPANSTLDDLSCSIRQRFICEGYVPDCTPTCPALCQKNPSLFNKKDELINVASYGKWYTFGSSTYMFSSAMVNQSTANDICCSIGMNLVSIETNEELQTLKTVANAQHFTSGSQIDCDFKYKWCGSGVRFHRNDSRWVPGQPNTYQGSQGCIVLINSGYLNDVDCSAPFNFICEMPALPACTKATCLDVECEIDPVKYMQSIAWKDVPNGFFRSLGGRQYFLSSILTTYTGASLECCKMGLELLSIETLEEMDLLRKNNIFGLANSVYIFWSSGYKDGIGCDNLWGWCPSGTNVSLTVPWVNDHVETCAIVQFGGAPSIPVLVDDHPCDLMHWYICEGSVAECKPSCPVKVCSKDPSLFDSAGKIINPGQYGTWRDACGGRYLFSSIRTTYYDAYKICCNLGMQLFIMNDDVELKCLTDLNNADMKFGGTFLTSASGQDCRVRYEFCPDTGIYFYSNDTRWSPGEGQAGETALILIFRVGSSTVFGDQFFSSIYNFICEGPVV
ncbi:macrophage mannose receptor 1-like [Neocloeon triangulifer]|uniref:macrophage mannose receptor 1-like n=1 Tax=Neocloeon triangulifer TaxID=2078957 RepID=UPI00286F7D39|nr:macrophage mannose receptor 1-like [Neocloeon triangulifer]